MNVKLWVTSANHCFHDHFIIRGAICPMAIPSLEMASVSLDRCAEAKKVNKTISEDSKQKTKQKELQILHS
jgi:hypothetical protein